MAERIISMRTLLRQNLEALGSPLRWGVLPLPILLMPTPVAWRSCFLTCTPSGVH